MVFQSYALYPHLSVREEHRVPAPDPRGPEGAARRAGAPTPRRRSGSTELLDRKPAQLSGGQRQRVALARAIVRDPQAFLMDEPLSNLDAKLRVQTRAELIELQRRLEATVVYVTHDQVEAMTMGHRIAIMSEGVLQQVGPPQDVYETPANLFVARFIGTPPMNTVPGPVVGEGDGIVVGASAPSTSTIADPTDRVAGARAPGFDATVVGGRVARPRAPRDLPACAADGDVRRVRQSSAPVADRAAPATRVADHLSRPTDVHRFDAATGNRL